MNMPKESEMLVFILLKTAFNLHPQINFQETTNTTFAKYVFERHFWFIFNVSVSVDVRHRMQLLSVVGCDGEGGYESS